MPRLIFTESGVDIGGGIELREIRRNCYQVWHDGEHIADLDFGEPVNLADGYGYRFLDTH